MLETISDQKGSYASITTTEVIQVDPVPTVPEPETWGMMFAGLGMLALTARRKKQA